MMTIQERICSNFNAYPIELQESKTEIPYRMSSTIDLSCSEIDILK